MRIALITLAVAALAFIGSIIWSVMGKSGVTSVKNPIVRIDEPADLSNVQIDIIKTNQKLYDKVEQLEAKIDRLTGWDSLSWSLANPAVSPPTYTETGKTEPPIIKVSGKFLSLVMPTVDFKLEANKGIYDLLTFESIPYSTYFDMRLGLKAFVIDISYDSFLKNMKATTREVYSINETKSFPFASFYVNSIKPDTVIRLVTEFENQTIALEIPKTKFPILKALLTKKETTVRPSPLPLPKPSTTKSLPTSSGTILKK